MLLSELSASQQVKGGNLSIGKPVPEVFGADETGRLPESEKRSGSRY
jgi:hypothetical protein